MALPKFCAGQRVAVKNMGRITAPPGIYSVIGAMPNGGGPIQYRVKSDDEKFERIVHESRLEANV